MMNGATSSTPAPADAGDEGKPRGEARWVRPLLIVAAALSLLLLGAAGGILLGLPGGTTPPTPALDSVDVGFAQDMTAHHQQAVEMAAWERDHTDDPVLARLAADMETTQNSQIGRMQGWLELWNAPALPLGEHMTWMKDVSHAHGTSDTGTNGVASMPGMASQADLAALRAATGRDLDVLFLQLMLRHHQGGTAMMEYAATHAERPQVRNLAQQMLRSQTAESDYLRQLLAERGGQPLPL